MPLYNPQYTAVLLHRLLGVTVLSKIRSQGVKVRFGQAARNILGALLVYPVHIKQTSELL